jgi:hypothetical protein
VANHQEGRQKAIVILKDLLPHPAEAHQKVQINPAIAVLKKDIQVALPLKEALFRLEAKRKALDHASLIRAGQQVMTTNPKEVLEASHPAKRKLLHHATNHIQADRQVMTIATKEASANHLAKRKLLRHETSLTQADRQMMTALKEVLAENQPTIKNHILLQEPGKHRDQLILAISLRKASAENLQVTENLQSPVQNQEQAISKNAMTINHTVNLFTIK